MRTHKSPTLEIADSSSSEGRAAFVKGACVREILAAVFSFEFLLP